MDSCIFAIKLSVRQVKGVDILPLTSVNNHVYRKLSHRMVALTSRVEKYYVVLFNALTAAMCCFACLLA